MHACVIEVTLAAEKLRFHYNFVSARGVNNIHPAKKLTVLNLSILKVTPSEFLAMPLGSEPAPEIDNSDKF